MSEIGGINIFCLISAGSSTHAGMEVTLQLVIAIITMSRALIGDNWHVGHLGTVFPFSQQIFGCPQEIQPVRSHSTTKFKYRMVKKVINLQYFKKFKSFILSATTKDFCYLWNWRFQPLGGRPVKTFLVWEGPRNVIFTGF